MKKKRHEIESKIKILRKLESLNEKELVSVVEDFFPYNFNQDYRDQRCLEYFLNETAPRGRDVLA